MGKVETLIGHPAIEALGVAILHALWQVSAVAIVLGLMLAAIPLKRAVLRYNLSMLALASCLMLFVGTFIWQIGQARPESASVAMTSVADTERPLNGQRLRPQEDIQPADLDMVWDGWQAFFSRFAPTISMIWLIGVCGVATRYLGGYYYLYRLPHHGAFPPAPNAEAKLEGLLQRVGMEQQVRLLESALVNSPFTFGHLRPMIMVPLGLLANMDPRQVEMLLLHELAHIRRSDFLANLFQVSAETLLFFHPLLWWISATVRREREHCCDDWAISHAGNDPYAYVRTLAKIQEDTIHPKPILAMHAFSSGNQTMLRILRILGRPSGRRANILPLFFIFPATLVLGMGFQGEKSPEADRMAAYEPRQTIAIASSLPLGERAVRLPFASAPIGPDRTDERREIYIAKQSTPSEAPNKAAQAVVEKAVQPKVALHTQRLDESPSPAPPTAAWEAAEQDSAVAAERLHEPSAIDPLFILNGKEVSRDKLASLIQYRIEKVELLKGKHATQYREKGKHGVVLITAKPDSSMRQRTLPDGTVCIPPSRLGYKGIKISLSTFGRENVAQTIEYANPDKDDDDSDHVDFNQGLILINGEEASTAAVEALHPASIDNIRVIKGDKAAVYGEKGKHGVVLITAKDVPPSPPVTTKVEEPAQTTAPINVASFQERNLLVFLDGEEIDYPAIGQKVAPQDIKSIEVLKGKEAVERFGKRAKKYAGVILITTKHGSWLKTLKRTAAHRYKMTKKKG